MQVIIPPPAKQTAFVSTPIDFLLVGGLSIIHLLIFTQPTLLQMSGLYFIAGWSAVLVWVINHPHFSATSHRLYRSKANIMQFPVTALGVPVLLVMMVTGALMFPTTIGPWFVKLFLIWSPYHFSAQTVGITMLYARRSGFIITPLMKRTLAFFVFGTYLGPTLGSETGGFQNYYGLKIPTFGLPYYFFDTKIANWHIFINCVIAAGVVCFIVLLREAWKQDKRIPLLMLVPPVAQYVWFIAGSQVNGFQEFVPAYHSLQYLLIAWMMNLKERGDEGKVGRTPLLAGFESTRWFAINCVGGVFLFYILPRAAGMAFHMDAFMATGITIAAVQIHHFFVDGVIWKLRNPKVGTPLMTTWPELTGKA